MIPIIEKPSIERDLDSKILVKENVLSPELCDEIISYGNMHVQKGVNKYNKIFPVSFHACLLDKNHYIHSRLESYWEDVLNFFKFDIQFVEPYELKRYTKGDFFGKHIDTYYVLKENLDRKITISIQLQDPNEYEGGNLRISSNTYKTPKGSIIAFPTYLSHDVSLITHGVRWSLIGWAWGPYWR